MPPFHDDEDYQPQQQNTAHRKKVFHRLYSHPTTELSRTQCKLQLQRLSYLTNDKNYLDHPQNMRRLTKELDRIDREYRNVRQFEDPIKESLKRLARSKNAPCQYPCPTSAVVCNSRSSSKRNSISSSTTTSDSSDSNTIQSFITVDFPKTSNRISGVNRIDFPEMQVKPVFASADAKTMDNPKGNFLRRWFIHILDDSFVHSSHPRYHHRQHNSSSSTSSPSTINGNSIAYSYHPTIANHLKRRALALNH